MVARSKLPTSAFPTFIVCNINMGGERYWRECISPVCSFPAAGGVNAHPATRKASCFADAAVLEEQLVVPVKEEELPSTLPDRCLMNCLTIILRCISLPFSCSWDAVLCWQHRPWPPPSELRLVSCEAELHPLPCPSFDMVERFTVTSLSGRLWKPPWYVSTQQHISRVLPEPVELWTCLMRPGRIVVVPVLLGICLLDSEVMTASILSKLQLVHHGSCSDSGVSSMHILVHHSIAYQPLEMSEHMARVGTVCSPCYVDVVDFGKFDDEQPEKLEALVVAVHSGGSSIPLAQYLVDQSIQSCFSPNWEYMISALGAVAMCDGLGMRPIPWPPFWYSAVEFGSGNATSRLLVDYELLKPRISWGGFLHFSASQQNP